MILDVAQAVMTAVGPPYSGPQLAQRQIKIIADDQQILQRQLVKVDQLSNTSAAQIHEGFGLHEQNPVWVIHPLSHLGLEATLESATAGAARQSIDHCKSNIVARPLVFASGVAETHHNLQVIGHLSVAIG